MSKRIGGKMFLFDPDIKWAKNGMGLKAYCPFCGKLLRYSHGCNLAGLGYAELGAYEDMQTHLPKCKN